MAKLVECVPNFSEGRREEVVREIARAIAAAGEVKILDVHMDASHNRSVITFVGPPAAAGAAAFQATRRAAELIDLEKHQGEHPRIGATDVIPFVPLADVTMEECVDLAQTLGERIGDELGIPVYLYGAAATRPDRRRLADIRRGEYEALKQEIATNPERAPDFGPSKTGSAGATVVGARPPLIAYNVNLDTPDVSVAKAVARAVRESSGGLPAIQALGIFIAERNCGQVTMNLTDHRQTPLHVAFEAVQREAEERGTRVASSEIVGLVPAEAVAQVAAHYLKLEHFGRRGILEARVIEE